ncbi:MAG: dephospho-CoA kinase [Elusimicrobia bacterium]|nr:dephospho-CoA kinase [Elusimicrobiota bacterium]
MLVVGLTGGIAAGKSSALREFSRLGARGVCLDEIAHELCRKGGPGYRRVVRAFGDAVLRLSGEIDRGKLGEIVFSSRSARKRLEALLHPLILGEMRRRLARSKASVAVVDVPLLFEGGHVGLFDVTVLVWADRSLQLRRLMARGGLSRAQALRRLEAQWPLGRKAALADVVIRNERSLQDLKSQVRQYYKAFELLSLGAASARSGK